MDAVNEVASPAPSPIAWQWCTEGKRAAGKKSTEGLFQSLLRITHAVQRVFLILTVAQDYPLKKHPALPRKEEKQGA